MFSNTSFASALTRSELKASITLYIFGSTIEYKRLVPSFRHLMIPASFRILRWRETSGWIRFRCGTISQTHFSPSRKYEIISSLMRSDSAWKTFDLNWLLFSELASIVCFNIDNNILKLLWKRYKLQVKGNFANAFFVV